MFVVEPIAALHFGADLGKGPIGGKKGFSVGVLSSLRGFKGGPAPFDICVDAAVAKMYGYLRMGFRCLHKQTV